MKPPLFQTSHTAGIPYWTAVATALGMSRNPPSPTTATAARSGAASRAPSTPPTPNPIDANPQLCSAVRGAEAAPLLDDPVVVDADVGEQDAVVGQHRAEVGEDALGPDRPRVRGAVRRDVRLPLALALGDARRATRARPGLGRAAASPASARRARARSSWPSTSFALATIASSGG